LHRYCKLTEKNPDELIDLINQGLKNIGSGIEFQAEMLLEEVLDEAELTNSAKTNMRSAVVSFYKHNRRGLQEPALKWNRDHVRERRPSLEDIDRLGYFATKRRDKALVWFIESTAVREGVIPTLTFADLHETGDKDVPR